MNSTQLVLIAAAFFAAFIVLRMYLNRPTVSPSEASAALQSGAAVLVDVRERDEWSEGVAGPAALLPLSDLRGPQTQWRPFLERNKGKRILLYCASGGRSSMAAAVLQRQGFDAANVGGFTNWSRAGLPVRRP